MVIKTNYHGLFNILTYLSLAILMVFAIFIHWILAVGLVIYGCWLFFRFSPAVLAVAVLVSFFFGVIFLLIDLNWLSNIFFGSTFILLLSLAIIRLHSDPLAIKEKLDSPLKLYPRRKNSAVYAAINILVLSGYVLFFNVATEASLLWHLVLLSVLIILANFIIWRHEIN